MNYFAVFLPMKDEEKSKTFRPDHLAYLKKMQEEGNLFAKGPFVDGAGGLVIYKAASLEQVEKFVQADPYIINGARDYDIHQWDMELT